MQRFFRSSYLFLIMLSLVVFMFACSTKDTEVAKDRALRQVLNNCQLTMRNLEDVLKTGDVAAAKDSVAVLSQKLVTIKTAALPARVAEDADKIKSQIDALATSLQDFSSLLSRPETSEIDSVCLAGFEAMHNNFARLGAMLRVKIPELTAYHTVLHKVWHDYYPNDDIEGIKASIPAFKEKAAAFENIQWPQVLADQVPMLKAKVKELQQALADLEAACQGDDAEAIKKATAAMHEKYASIKRML